MGSMGLGSEALRIDGAVVLSEVKGGGSCKKGRARDICNWWWGRDGTDLIRLACCSSFRLVRMDSLDFR